MNIDQNKVRDSGIGRNKRETGEKEKKPLRFQEPAALGTAIRQALDAFPEDTAELRDYKEGLQNEFESIHASKLEILDEKQTSIDLLKPEMDLLKAEIEEAGKMLKNIEETHREMQERQEKQQTELFSLAIEKGLRHISPKDFESTQQQLQMLEALESLHGEYNPKLTSMRRALETNLKQDATENLRYARKPQIEEQLLAAQKELGGLQYEVSQIKRSMQGDLAIVNEFLDDIERNAGAVREEQSTPKTNNPPSRAA